jgi:hypothetical protein
MVVENDGAYVKDDWHAKYRIETAPESGRELIVALVTTDTPELDNKDNVDFIVRACNAHEALFDALLLALPYIEDVLADEEKLACFKPGVVQAHRRQVCAALAKAEGK